MSELRNITHEEVVSAEKQKEKQLQLKKLRNAFDTLLKNPYGGGYAHVGEEGFSGDAASLYAITSFTNENGESSSELLKIGWGEFSKQTFEGNAYPHFHNCPIDVYCVSQQDSYFADEKLQQEQKENPAKYLTEHSVFAASNGKVVLAERVEGNRRHLSKEITAMPYEEMLRAARNAIIQQQSEPEEFASFLRELPDDPEKLGAYIRDIEDAPSLSDNELKTASPEEKIAQRQQALLFYLKGMGVDTAGIRYGNKQSMESLLELKNRFDFETKSFT